MDQFRLNARWFAVIASLAIMASAFAPTVTRLLADVLGVRIVLAEMCTVDPTSGAPVAMAIDFGSSQPDGGTSTQRASDCPYCVPHAFSFALPTAPHSFTVLSLASDGPPLRFLQSHRPLFAWIAAAPRGPPLES